MSLKKLTTMFIGGAECTKLIEIKAKLAAVKPAGLDGFHSNPTGQTMIC